MTKTLMYLSIAILAAVCSASVQALPELMLADDGTNLSTLEIGDSFTLEVELIGLEAGDALEFLAITVEYDDALLSIPTIDAGGIVPDIDGFLALEDLGLADASYDSFDSLSGELIEVNGVFYSFEITALAEGGGDVSITFADALGLDAAGGDIDGVTTSTDSLPYSITVPEPASVILLGLGLGLITRRRR